MTYAAVQHQIRMDMVVMQKRDVVTFSPCIPGWGFASAFPATSLFNQEVPEGNDAA